MKQLAAGALLIVFLPLINSAQKINLGPSAKAGISQLLYVKTTTSDHDLSNKVKFSWQAGIFSTWNFSKRWSLDLELLYWQQNGHLFDVYSYTDANNVYHQVEDSYQSDLNYVALPICFLYRLQKAQLMLGAQGASLLSQKTEIHRTEISNAQTTEETLDEVPSFGDIDLGFKAGIHYRITDDLTAGVEYYNGRTNLSKDTGIDYNTHNQYVYAAFRFNIIQKRKEEFYTN